MKKQLCGDCIYYSHKGYCIHIKSNDTCADRDSHHTCDNDSFVPMIKKKPHGNTKTKKRIVIDENKDQYEISEEIAERRREVGRSRPFFKAVFTGIPAMHLEPKPVERMTCKWKDKDTEREYKNFISGCRIESGSLGKGWTYCPYCGKEIEYH